MTTPLRVLLIEASETEASDLLDAFRRGGYEPSWARVDTSAALERTLVEEWGVVLCNWRLGQISGPQALGMAREKRPDLPFVGFSSDTTGGDALAALDGGADDFVDLGMRKRLVSTVERVMREAEARTVRRRADEALRESGERFSQAFENAPIGMAIVGIDGLMLHANLPFARMFGYQPEEMVGMPVWQITHPDDMMRTLEQLRQLVGGESNAWFLEKRYFHRDGRVLWGRSTTWLVRGPDGLARYVVSHLQDITREKELEEQMRLQQSELAHVLRIATMGEMVALIAHEINQPLASIANFANALARKPGDVEDTRTVAAQIAREALRASDVIRRLRGFLRKGEVRREPCPANDLVRDALQLMEPEIHRHAIDVHLDLAAEGVLVEADRVQLVQVVLNLLRNSVEAMAANGNPRALEVRTEANGDGRVEVSVCDSGVGLPPDANIFDAFFTTKERGLGLGLSISRSIVESHGGELRAEPNEGHGATVRFSLPVRAS